MIGIEVMLLAAALVCCLVIAVARRRGGEQETYITKTGRALTDDDIWALAEEAERGYDVSALKARRDMFEFPPGVEPLAKTIRQADAFRGDF